ncbi:MAG: RagB/SusD family nutrient uptake outer membrane protein [Carboxylicivirga sp.]|jgi:hypothetical protein|nr:RagB/SusD family nutrient uptake outer membrane protein [Carboxylicivirga sp.]
MMKQILFAGIFSALLFSACTDSFFETAPQNQLSDAIFWRTEKDFTYAVNALYPYLEGSGNLSLEALSDNVIRNQNWYDEYQITSGSATDETGTFASKWNHYYECIRKANTLLDKIEPVELNETFKANIVAQARFFRAYCHFYLAFHFNDVPIVDHVLTIDESRSIGKTTQADVYKWVFNELDAVETPLPSEWADDQKGRISKYAVQAMKARFYLYSGNDKMAATEAFKIIDDSPFSLHGDYAEVFQYAGENCDEHILQHMFLKDVHTSGTWSHYAPLGAGGGSSLSPLRSLFDSYLCTDGKTISESEIYDPANPADNRDPRLAATVLIPGAMFGDYQFNSMTEGSPDFIGTGFDATRSGLNLLKNIIPEDKQNDRQSECDWSIIRYAEVLLIYAEAKINQNQLDDVAKKALNDLRYRVGMPEIVFDGKTPAELQEIVRRERRVELALEGHRFFDIIRWDIAEDVMTGKIYGLDTTVDGVTGPHYISTRTFGERYFWPIPRKEIELNDNLRPQNSKW